jgi:hypothetical protein
MGGLPRARRALSAYPHRPAAWASGAIAAASAVRVTNRVTKRVFTASLLSGEGLRGAVRLRRRLEPLPFDTLKAY